ncbi:MAG: Na+/H+ antiporter NhaC [Oleispira sp.]|jgi:Na+/H+ antiporter NhaC
MTTKSPWALLPMFSFMVLFIGSGLYYQAEGIEFAFYKISAPVAILPAIILALLLAKGTINQRVDQFIQGCSNPTIVTMLLIFLLAGGFASVAKAIGGVDAVVNLSLSAIPPSFVLPGLFIMTAFMATAMGTSMGSIAAVAPIAVGVAEASDLSLVLAVGTVMGGAMFGDNLSIISDTTIAATRTQGCNMRDKFRLNFKIAVPAALLTIVWLYIQGDAAQVAVNPQASATKMLPYLLVLGLAIAGMNVIAVLLTGIIVAGLIGLWQVPDYSVAVLSSDIYTGYSNMQEILILSLFIGGLGAMMKLGGGLDWLAAQLDRLTREQAEPKAHRRMGELSIAAGVALVNVCTANNTVAILISGSLAKDIAGRYGVDPKRSASIMDISACVIQGILPYGAQMLLAASLSGLSSLDLVTAVVYCWCLGLVMMGSIILGLPNGKVVMARR